MHGYSRRSFLRRTLGTCAGLGAAKCLTGCNLGVPGPFIPSPDDVPFAEASRVTAVRGTDLYAMTREALEGVGGMASIVGEGETVFIKPNWGGLGFVDCNVFTSGESTKIEVVLTVAEECLRAGAAEVVIGEGGQVSDIPWARAVALDGSTTLLAEIAAMNERYAGFARVAALEIDSPGWEQLDTPHTDLDHILVSKLVTEADKVISIAVPKSHRWARITGSLKNFVGTTPFAVYGMGMGWRFMLHDAAGGVEQCFLDIARTVQPDLAIIDGSICCEGNGPHVMPGYWGETIDVADTLGDWFLLASTDPAAADATAARIIGLDAAEVPYLVQARDQGIGQIDEDKITLDGATVAELSVPFKPADLTVGFNEVFFPGIMLQYFSGAFCPAGA